MVVCLVCKGCRRKGVAVLDGGSCRKWMSGRERGGRFEKKGQRLEKKFARRFPGGRK